MILTTIIMNFGMMVNMYLGLIQVMLTKILMIT